MNVGLLILFLLNLHNVLSDYLLEPVGLSHRKSPKKNLQIILSRRYFKPVSEARTLRANPFNTGYTAFPMMIDVEKKIYNVPDSPYFQTDMSQKHRVKKVLPDFALRAGRKKRSADTKDVAELTVELEKVTSTNQTVSETIGNTTKTSKKTKKSRSRTKNSKKQKSVKRSRTSSTKIKHEKRIGDTKRHSKAENTTKNVKSKKNKRSRREGKKKHSKKGTKASRRLIAAKDAVIEDYPYVVSIQKGDEHWCAGALLNQRLVITTANCVWKANRVSRLKVRAGSRNSISGGQTARVQDMLKHPHWSIRRSPDNDLALLMLDRAIRFSDSVHGVDLPNRGMLPAFEDAWVTSWGAERRDGVYDKHGMTLQSIHVTLVDRPKCNNITQRYGVIVSENFICFSQMGKRGPCTRDTGAPAVSDGVLWGLASWGIRKLCGTQRFPAMFSYIASPSNMDFIVNATHELMAEKRLYPFPDRFPAPVMRAEHELPTMQRKLFTFP